MGRRGRIIAGVAGAGVALAVAVIAGAALWRWQAGPLQLSRIEAVSRIAVDRDERLLRAFATPDGLWRLPVDMAGVDARFQQLLTAYEDKRFHSHGGVDMLAMARAAQQWLHSGRIISGGSTITMQTARLLEPRTERSLTAKARQMLRALELESRLGKQEILRAYLTLAPYGGNIEGVRAASLAYFGKEPRRLTISEAALLIALPQSPEARRPDRFAANARKARDTVLERLAKAGAISPFEADAAKQEGVPQGRQAFPMLAPHLAEQEMAKAPAAPVMRLTIDARLQAALQPLVRERAQALGPRIGIALVVINNATGEVRAHIGSPDYFDHSRAGAVDLSLAVRSPGSALKPFIYALAFDQGLAHPETLFEDRPLRYGTYAPENFDLRHQGTVSARLALQMSLNIPVVELLKEVGPARFVTQLRNAGAQISIGGNAPVGLAAGLGGLGIHLRDLSRLYGAFTRGGDTLPLVVRKGGFIDSRAALTGHIAAWYVADILRGTPPPDSATGGRIAFKTGTSYGYRDAWAVGFDRRWTIGVWVGRPDGAPVAGLTGRSAAAPLLFEAFARTGTTPEPVLQPADALHARSSASLPPPLRVFGAHTAGQNTGSTDAPLRLTFPPDGARVELFGEAQNASGLVVKAQGGVPPLSFLLDGVPVGTAGVRRSLVLAPPGRGFARLTVMDAQGASDSVNIRFE